MAEGPETDPKLVAILRGLIDREPIFHRPELGTTQVISNG
jgi:hypothetical protein